MMRLFRSRDPFTPEARCRWENIPEWAQKKILDNVFCVKCLGSVTILLKRAEMDGSDLVLKGKCQNCGKNVCRVVEPEN